MTHASIVRRLLILAAFSFNLGASTANAVVRYPTNLTFPSTYALVSFVRPGQFSAIPYLVGPKDQYVAGNAVTRTEFYAFHYSGSTPVAHLGQYYKGVVLSGRVGFKVFGAQNPDTSNVTWVSADSANTKFVYPGTFTKITMLTASGASAAHVSSTGF